MCVCVLRPSDQNSFFPIEIGTVALPIKTNVSGWNQTPVVLHTGIDKVVHNAGHPTSYTTKQQYLAIFRPAAATRRRAVNALWTNPRPFRRSVPPAIVLQVRLVRGARRFRFAVMASSCAARRPGENKEIARLDDQQQRSLKWIDDFVNAKTAGRRVCRQVVVCVCLAQMVAGVRCCRRGRGRGRSSVVDRHGCPMTRRALR